MTNYFSRTYIGEKWRNAGFQKYLRNTGWMFFGQLSMIVSLLINIWMARHLGPGNFGTISYIFAFVGIFSFLANFGINDILIRDLVQHPEKKDKLLGTAFRLLTIGGVSAFILTSISAFIFESSPLARTLIILYATIFLWSPANVISAYFQATVQAKKNALAQMAGTAITSLLKIFLLVTGQGIIWLTLAFALDYVVGAILHTYNYRKSGLRVGQWMYDKNIAANFMTSSYLLMLSAAAGFILLKIDQVMVKFYLNETAVGLYAAAVKLSEVWYFIPGIICMSLFPAIINAKKTHTDLYRERLRKLYLLLGTSAFVIALPMAFLAPWINSLLFGPAYAASAPILQVYIWSGVGMFLSIGINRYFMAENRLSSIFYYSLLAVVANILLNIILIPRIGLTGAAWATLISYLIGPLMFFLLNHKKSYAR